MMLLKQNDITGKINKLKRCARNLGGKKTQYNQVGTWVRGFVVAEHHNQLVDATIAVEQFSIELEAKLALLQEVPQCLNDNDCPSVTF